jgi:hypothetical protein
MNALCRQQAAKKKMHCLVEAGERLRFVFENLENVQQFGDR